MMHRVWWISFATALAACFCYFGYRVLKLAVRLWSAVGEPTESWVVEDYPFRILAVALQGIFWIGLIFVVFAIIRVTAHLIRLHSNDAQIQRDVK